MSFCEETCISLEQNPDTLIDMLRRQAEKNPDKQAFVHLLDGLKDEDISTYAQLDQRARAIAARLQNMGLAGERVVLAYPPGLDFIAAFFGCMYANCTAVPTYPPLRHRAIDNFNAIADNAGASIAMSTSIAIAQFQSMIERKGAKAVAPYKIEWLATDEIPDTLSGQWKQPLITPDTLAMLQYTSGSTSKPKGVMLTHANLIDNTFTIQNAFGVHKGDSAVFWLPTYHDMGLIGGILVAVFAGVTNVLISPAHFLHNPITWLSAISKYRATVSGGPNFAYDLCVRNITDEQKSTLDLSSWAVAFIGAEPIHPATMERFTAAFACCGFKPSAFYPCYGLAEATLMVSGPTRDSGATIRAFDKTALTKNIVESMPDDGNYHSHRLVACGPPTGNSRVVIVDSKTQTQAAAGCVGEIWVCGKSVSRGYWNNPGHTSRCFNVHLSPTDKAPFLRTGDLGFINDGQLYVTGRTGDLIIVRGQNRYPQDIEEAARTSHPLLELGSGAVFSVDDNGSLRIILVQEVKINTDMNFKPILDAIRIAVLEENELALDTVALVRIGTIPKTSSGKVQRNACRDLFLTGGLKTLAQYNTDICKNADSPIADSWQTSAFTAVCEHAKALAGTAVGELTPDKPIAALGLDSLQRLELVAAMEKTFGGYMPDTAYIQAHTLGQLAHAVQKYLIDSPRPDAAKGTILPQQYDLTQFPEYIQLKAQEQMLMAVAESNPYFRVDQGGVGNAAFVDGQQLINFCIYDYIGMSHDPQVIAAAKNAIDRYGTGAGASRLISGEKQIHRELEQALAAFLNVPAAIVFVSGHATNVTTIGHLLGPDDLILHDNLAHNSIIQGAKLSGATRRAFAHNDWMAMDAVLCESRHRYRRVLLAVEGVYSMDGDFPELPRFVELKKKHKTLMLVDEAHSLGTMGATGRGIGEFWGIERADVDLWMGTLSKSLASCGGYIAGSAEMVEYLKYTAPGFVYSVGISPSNAAAALASLTILQQQPRRVELLRELSELFLQLAKEKGLDTGLACGTPVIPIIVGSSVKSLQLSNALFKRGINVQPILYPVVPEQSARLRFFITTNHTKAQIEATINAIAEELEAIDKNSGSME